jgi:hypothetical protein
MACQKMLVLVVIAGSDGKYDGGCEGNSPGKRWKMQFYPLDPSGNLT